MPNHVRNVWKIKGIPQDKVNYLLNKLAVQLKDKENYIIDFDLIIPEPRFIQDCPKRFRVNSKSHVEEIKDRAWFNWYDWRVENWGTKWGAYDGYTKIGKTQLTFVFSTAWSFAYPVAQKLFTLGYDLDLRYADEAIGSNCGRLTYNAATKEVNHYDESELTDASQFANYLWNNY